MNKVLISGASSGLGLFLANELNANVYNRNESNLSLLKNNEFDIIIHCAFGMPNKYENDQEYLKNQIILADNLISIKHNYFVFISSIEAIVSDSPMSRYGKAKLEIEKLILEKTSNNLILRPGALMGTRMRPNHILKVATGSNEKLTLAENSNFSINYYFEILEFIYNKLSGVHNILDNNVVTLGQIAHKFNKSPKWGEVIYDSSIYYKNINLCKCMKSNLITEEPIEKLLKFIETKGWL
jgi:hypothetical protein